MIQIVLKLEDVSSRPPHCRDGVVAVPSKPAEGSPKDNSTHGIAVETSRSSGAVAGALTLGVIFLSGEKCAPPIIHRGEIHFDGQKIGKIQPSLAASLKDIFGIISEK